MAFSDDTVVPLLPHLEHQIAVWCLHSGDWFSLRTARTWNTTQVVRLAPELLKAVTWSVGRTPFRERATAIAGNRFLEFDLAYSNPVPPDFMSRAEHFFDVYCSPEMWKALLASKQKSLEGLGFFLTLQLVDFSYVYCRSIVFLSKDPLKPGHPPPEIKPKRVRRHGRKASDSAVMAALNIHPSLSKSVLTPDEMNEELSFLAQFWNGDQDREVNVAMVNIIKGQALASQLHFLYRRRDKMVPVTIRTKNSGFQLRTAGTAQRCVHDGDWPLLVAAEAAKTSL